MKPQNVFPLFELSFVLMVLGLALLIFIDDVGVQIAGLLIGLLGALIGWYTIRADRGI